MNTAQYLCEAAEHLAECQFCTAEQAWLLCKPIGVRVLPNLKLKHDRRNRDAGIVLLLTAAMEAL